MRGTGFSRVPIFHEDRDRIVGHRAAQGPRQPALRGRPRRADHRAHARGGLRPGDQGDPAAALGDARHAQPDGDRRRRVRRHRRARDAWRTSSRRSWARSPTSSTATTASSSRSVRASGSSTGGSPSRRPSSAGIPAEESDEYETIAGWLLSQLGHIPVPGERYERKGYQFRVQTMRRRRIARIRVTAPEETGAEREGRR